MKRIGFCISALFVILAMSGMMAVFAGDGERITGLVVSVYDGDTVTMSVTTKDGYIKVRLAEIDAPERDQPGGALAKAVLAYLVMAKEVTVYQTNIDRYGRLVGLIAVGGLDVNSEMVRRGVAWHYKAYSKNKKLAILQAEAARSQRGIWVLPTPQAPWEWRKEKRVKQERSK